MDHALCALEPALLCKVYWYLLGKKKHAERPTHGSNLLKQFWLVHLETYVFHGWGQQVMYEGFLH